MVLTMLLIVGIGQAWGETVTISGSDTWSGGQSGGGKALYITKGGITINISSGYKYSTTEIRWYSGAIMSVSSEVGNITQMKFTISSNASEVTVPNNSSGSYSDKTWTGDSNDFTLKSTKQVKWSSVTITYTPSGGGSTCTEPTVEWNTKPANGEVGGSMTTSVTTNYSNGLTYSSSNTSVATVTNAGVINYLATGTTTITATVTGDGTTICEGPVSVQQEITVTAPAGGGDGDCDKWVEVQLADIEQTDDIVITMTNGTTTWALTNGNGTSKAPAATVLTVNLDKSISDNIISSAIKWNISNNNGTLTIYPTGVTNKWLYCNSANDGVRVGTNTSKTFTIETSKQDGVDYKYLKHIGTSRYLGIYTGTPDWRCYTTATSNNAKQTLKFYVQQCTAEPTVYLIPKCGGDGGGTWLVVIEWFATF